MKVQLHRPSCDDYVACLQKGGSPFYSGSVMQRGHGIGGLFRSLASSLLPLLPKVGKFVAKTALGVASDKLAGIPLSRSVKKRATTAGKKMILDAISNRPAATTTRPVKRNKRKRTTTSKRIRRTDAFGTV